MIQSFQTISKTAEGWRQISETRDGWQRITHGTVLSNALVYDLRSVLQYRLQISSAIEPMPFSRAWAKGIAPKVSWTPSGLRDHMGIGMKESKLAFNTEQHDTYFDLLTTLELLPKPGEEREHWFIRIKDYEITSNVLLDDMVKTMLDLKRKEIQKSKVPIVVNAEDAAKEVYVLGQLSWLPRKCCLRLISISEKSWQVRREAI